jgi:excinuclease UvrABC ATPase subunit
LAAIEDNQKMDSEDDQKKKSSDIITYYTDKNFCPQCNITYPDFTPQHFSPNRQE